MKKNKWFIKHIIFIIIFTLLCFKFYQLLPNIITKFFFNTNKNILEYTKLILTSSLIAILFQYTFYKKNRNLKELGFESIKITILFFIISLPFMSALQRKTLLFFVLFLTSLGLNIYLKKKIPYKNTKYLNYFIYIFIIIFYLLSIIFSFIF